MAASLLRQLIVQLGTLIFNLNCKKRHDEAMNRPLELSEILEDINSCFNEFSSVFVFLDGLDECSNDQQNEIIEFIQKLRSSTIRLFLTSQPHLDTQVLELENVDPLNISARDEDIKLYVRQRINTHRPKITADKDLIFASLTNTEEADGM